MPIVIVVAGFLIACTDAYAGDVQAPPLFVEQLIKKYSESPTENPPASIWRYRFRGSEVYYIPPRCCDRYGEVFDSNGKLLCAPDGGITGTGDGKCPNFAVERSDGVLIWEDPR